MRHKSFVTGFNADVVFPCRIRWSTRGIEHNLPATVQINCGVELFNTTFSKQRQAADIRGVCRHHKSLQISTVSSPILRFILVYGLRVCRKSATVRYDIRGETPVFRVRPNLYSDKLIFLYVSLSLPCEVLYNLLSSNLNHASNKHHQPFICEIRRLCFGYGLYI